MTSTALVDPMASVEAYLKAEKASNTRKGYSSDWTDFTTWCAAALTGPPLRRRAPRPRR